MTLRQAERITGLEIREIPRQGIGNGRTYAAFDLGVEVCRRSASGDSAAIKAVVDTVYRRRCLQTFREQGHRCLQCGRLGRALTGHHIVPRARGRSDLRINLSGLDNDCHELITLNKVRLAPHPKVLELVRKNGGLEWRNGRWAEIAT